MSASKGKSWQLQFRMLNDWVPSWPLSEPHTANIVMSLGPTGLVDLTQWQALVDDENQLALMWWNSIVLGSSTTISGKLCAPLLQLFARAVASPYPSFLQQLVW